jgi:hypothetical protein
MRKKFGTHLSTLLGNTAGFLRWLIACVCAGSKPVSAESSLIGDYNFDRGRIDSGIEPQGLYADDD